MATVTSPTMPSEPRAAARQRVQHPLERLRGFIRLYVTLEGLAILGLYLALWFWIGMLIDFGFFKAFGLDWVQELPWAFRAILLCGLLAGLVAMVTLKILFRLFREFRAGPLALVLERRFPDLLGDRLITAVELSDPALADQYGFSPMLMEHTILDAARRVERLPIDQVFNWRRLRRSGLTLAALTLGLYLLVGAGYCLGYQTGLEDYVVRFHTTASIWAERNLLLANTLWPRRAHLELIDFPASGELRIGRNAPPPTMRVRAVKWVLADSSAPEGWRALRASDLTPEILGADVTVDAIPASWRDWPIDQIETELDKPETRNALDADTMLALRGLLEQLEVHAGNARMARRLRQLVIPDSVEILYQGETSRSEQRLQKQNEQDYAGVLSDLKETVRFTVHGEDYYTPYKQITVVPPPGLVELTRDEYQPAYLYHRLPEGTDPAQLRGRKQEFKDLPVSLGGNASRIDVPAGTDLVLRAGTDKPLQRPGGVRLKDAPETPAPLIQPDDHSFQVAFKNVVSPIDVVFEFVDTDQVVGWRQVVIKPLDDMPPEVDTLVEVIRKTNQGYLVTPRAHIPFSGKIRDDHGLSNIEIAYTVTSIDTSSIGQAGPAVSALQITPGGLGQPLLGAAYLAWLGLGSRAATDESRPPEKLVLAPFARRLRERSAEATLPEDLPARLKEKPQQTLLRDFSVEPSFEDAFDVEKLGLRSSDERQVQPHYRLRIWMIATDSNIETGPGVGQSKERFTFQVISENELLAEIAKEEESLHLKLEGTVNHLKESRTKLDQVVQELPTLKPDEFSPMALRTEEITDVLIKSWDITREVHTDYRRILKELQFNRVQPGIVSRVERNICEPLEGALNLEFVQAEEALRGFHKTLENRKADPKAGDLARVQMDQLIDRLSRVLDAMGDVTTINKLIALLVEVEKGERREFDRLKKLRDDLQERILDDLLAPAPAVKPKDGKP